MLSAVLFNTVMGSLTISIIKGIQIEKEEAKLSLLAD